MKVPCEELTKRKPTTFEDRDASKYAFMAKTATEDVRQVVDEFLRIFRKKENVEVQRAMVQWIVDFLKLTGHKVDEVITPANLDDALAGLGYKMNAAPSGQVVTRG